MRPSSEEVSRGRTPVVVSLGETMVQVVPVGGGQLVGSDLFRLAYAGAESNVAVHLARLGNKAVWVSRIGSDALGHRIARALAAEGVDGASVVSDDKRPTGVFFKDPGLTRNVLYYRSGSAASAMDETDVLRAVALAPDLMHLTGITPALSASCREATLFALQECRAQGILVSFDVNYRPSLWREGMASPASELAFLGGLADVVFVGSDEAQELWGASDLLSVRRIFPRAGVVVIKNGPGPAESHSGGESYSVEALPVEVVESVGAGDAFAAGWLHGYLHGLGELASLRLGHLIAGVALRSVTDQGEWSGPASYYEDLARSDDDWARLAQGPSARGSERLEETHVDRRAE
jgi:2-dehydro-3-deoxygluconokinase